MSFYLERFIEQYAFGYDKQPTAFVYENYVEFCLGENVVPLSHTKFSQELRQRLDLEIGNRYIGKKSWSCFIEKRLPKEEVSCFIKENIHDLWDLPVEYIWKKSGIGISLYNFIKLSGLGIREVSKLGEIVEYFIRPNGFSDYYE